MTTSSTTPPERYCVIERRGVSFSFRGDDLLYVWPWTRRGQGWRYISWGSDATWRSLDDVMAFWRGYFRHEGATLANVWQHWPPLSRWQRLLERLLP